MIIVVKKLESFPYLQPITDTGWLVAKKVKAIQKEMNDVFSEEEFRQFCFELTIKYENLEGETKGARIRSFVEFFERLNQIDMLIGVLESERPNARWPLADGL